MESAWRISGNPRLHFLSLRFGLAARANLIRRVPEGGGVGLGRAFLLDGSSQGDQR